MTGYVAAWVARWLAIACGCMGDYVTGYVATWVATAVHHGWLHV